MPNLCLGGVVWSWPSFGTGLASVEYFLRAMWPERCIFLTWLEKVEKWAFLPIHEEKRKSAYIFLKLVTKGTRFNNETWARPDSFSSYSLSSGGFF